MSIVEDEVEETIQLTARDPIVIDVTLTARTPMLMHKYSASVGPQESTPTTQKYDDEWRKTAYVDPEGFLYVPDTCIEAMILAAGRSRKVGKHYLKKYIASGVIVAEQFPRVTIKGKNITLSDVEKNHWVDTQGAIVGKSRIDRRRVRLSDWELRFTIKLDSPLITAEILKQILIAASTNEGLLDQRPGSPNKPGKFGQFYVSRFDYKH
jgi:hypothetical protein